MLVKSVQQLWTCVHNFFLLKLYLGRYGTCSYLQIQTSIADPDPVRSTSSCRIRIGTVSIPRKCIFSITYRTVQIVLRIRYVYPRSQVRFRNTELTNEFKYF
jgi:hypothetical protein